MITSDNFIYDEIVRMTGWTNSGEPFYSLTQVKDGSLQVQTDNSVDVTDAKGSLIETLKRGERGTFSANNALFSWGLLAAQSGDHREVASESNKIVAPVSETFTLTANQTSVVLKKVPVGTAGNEIGGIMIVNPDGTLASVIKQGAAAAADVFALDAETKTITLNTGLAAGTRIVVEYEAEITKGFKITKDAISKNRQHKVRALCLGHEPCDLNTQYAAWMVFPSAKLNNEITIDFAPDMDHAFELEFMQGYCDAKKVLYEVYLDGDEGDV